MILADKLKEKRGFIPDDMVIIEATPVYNAFVKPYIQGGNSNMAFDNIGCCSPSFSHFWIEWSQLHRNKNLVVDNGISFLNRGLRTAIECYSERVVNNGCSLLDDKKCDIKLCDGGWIILGNGCSSDGEDFYLPIPCEVVMSIDSAGEIIDSDYLSVEEYGIKEYFNDELIRPLFNQLTMMIAYVFAFANCKNVELIEKSWPDKIQKKRIKTGKLPLVSYRQVVISTISGKKIDITNHDGQHSSPALHLMRGHFKDFSNGRGLFGKYNGKYWWNQSMRGDKESGIISKTYKVI